MKKEYVGYVYEKLYLAVENLASGTKTIQQRINNVYQCHLVLLQNELKEERLKKFVNEMNEYIKNTEYYTFEEVMKLIEANNMGESLLDEQANKIAKTIFGLFNYVNKIH